jgi:hypothetical protein
MFCLQTEPQLFLLTRQLLPYHKNLWQQPEAKQRTHSFLPIEDFLRLNSFLAGISSQPHRKTQYQRKTPKQIFDKLFSQQQKLQAAIDK